MQTVNYCLLYYFLGEAKNDYTAAIVGGSIARVALILCISAVAFVMFLRLRKDGSRNLKTKTKTLWYKQVEKHSHEHPTLSLIKFCSFMYCKYVI